MKMNERDRGETYRNLLPKEQWLTGFGPVKESQPESPKDKGYYFEFRKDKKWYFAGVVGD